MHLSTIDLFELGQYLRIALWICLPLIVISLLVTTWLHYRRRMLDPGGWRLSIEGFDSAMEPMEPIEPIEPPEPERISHGPADSLSYRERDPHEQSAPDPHERSAPDPDIRAEHDPRDNDQWGKENVSEWKSKDNIYQGILWMKDKYEQYRDQSDHRYALLKEELSRPERRYQDLLLSAEGNKVAQPIIDELEEQLRVERLKVEELVSKLQSNSQLLMNIYQELDKSVDLPKEAQ